MREQPFEELRRGMSIWKSIIKQQLKIKAKNNKTKTKFTRKINQQSQKFIL